MKLNPDCIRDILIIVESLPSISFTFTFDEDSIAEYLPNYSYDEVIYHLRQCELCGFFYRASFSMNRTCTVTDLSPKGHQFLADIRSDNIWKKTKNVATQIGSFSLDTLVKISSAVITELIKQQFN